MKIPRVCSRNLGFYHYLGIFGILLNLRSLFKYNHSISRIYLDAKGIYFSGSHNESHPQRSVPATHRLEMLGLWPKEGIGQEMSRELPQKYKSDKNHN